jgi:uracil-DNA glycosylase
MEKNINNDWKIILKDEFEQEYFKKLKLFLATEECNNVIYPSSKDRFRALNLTPFNNVKVVILGQDPYHNKKQANGLSFSVQKNIKIPPSLNNIYKELKNDMGIKINNSGDLSAWAKQGVLLLNTILSVEEGKANSHKNKGWEIFTSEIIKQISLQKIGIVFVLWGKNAQEKEKLINSSKHLILKAPHPSPLSSYRGFFGSKPFSKINKYLLKNGKKKINWNLE